MSKFKKVVASLSVLTVLSSGTYIANQEYKKVALAIDLNDSTIGVKVNKGTVKEILASQGIVVDEKDRVEPGLDTQVEPGQRIKIIKARDIKIKDNGEETTYKTTYKKVEDILKELNITLESEDKVNLPLDKELSEDEVIEITRAEKSTEEESTEATQEQQVAAEVSPTQNSQVVSNTNVAQTQQYAVQPPAVQSSYQQSANGQVRLANGNTAGEAGSYAAKQMEARTGVAASTWEHIIARESNGQVNARNASGASGLFQTMPGWGSTATVDDQINAAVKAYNSQGLAAWGM